MKLSNVLTREQLNALVGIIAILVSAAWPVTRPYLEYIVPAVFGILALLIGIPAGERIASAFISYKVMQAENAPRK